MDQTPVGPAIRSGEDPGRVVDVKIFVRLVGLDVSGVAPVQSGRVAAVDDDRGRPGQGGIQLGTQNKSQGLKNEFIRYFGVHSVI